MLKEIGHLHNAEAALLRAQQGFKEEGIALEMAWVCMDLADLYVKLEKFDRVRSMLSEAIPIFRSLRVGAETWAALLQLQQAAEENGGGE